MPEMSEKTKKAFENARVKTETYQQDFMAWINASQSNDVDKIMPAFHKKEASLKEANEASHQAYLLQKEDGLAD